MGACGTVRILITNDDGINAPGLAVMEAIARDIGGDKAEVWVVAPGSERSGVAHCITYTHPTMITRLDERRVAVDGYPADCVLAGLYHVLPEWPELVLSGVNRGNNSGENTVYSGTIGAAMEAALQHVPAIALSQFYGPANAGLSDPFEAARDHGAAVVRAILDAGLWGDGGYRTFYNVNFPPCPAADVRGTRVVRQGFRPTTRHQMIPHEGPNSSREFLWITGGAQAVDTGPGTDVTANTEGYISVTPLTCDLTDDATLPALRDRLE